MGAERPPRAKLSLSKPGRQARQSKGEIRSMVSEERRHPKKYASAIGGRKSPTPNRGGSRSRSPRGREEIELVDQDRVLHKPLSSGSAVLVLLYPAGESDPVAAPKTLNALACSEAVRHGIDVHDTGCPQSSFVVPRHCQAHGAPNAFAAVLVQLRILNERPDQRDAVQGRPPAIRFSGMGGSLSCAGPGAFQRRPAA